MVEGSTQQLFKMIEEQAESILLLIGLLAALGFDPSDLAPLLTP